MVVVMVRVELNTTLTIFLEFNPVLHHVSGSQIETINIVTTARIHTISRIELYTAASRELQKKLNKKPRTRSVEHKLPSSMNQLK